MQICCSRENICLRFFCGIRDKKSTFVGLIYRIYKNTKK